MTLRSAPVAGRSTDAPTLLGRYVHCIVEAEDGLELGSLGVGDEDAGPYAVYDGGFAAVVSTTPYPRHAPNRENLLTHERVVEAVMRHHSVIPMSFGTILPTDADVVALLRGIGPALAEASNAVRGRMELGLTVVWDRERVLGELEARNEPIRSLKDEIVSEGAGSTCLPRVRLGHLIEEALQERGRELTRGIYEPLRSLSISSRAGTLIGDDMLLNLTFLVDRAREDEFSQAVHRLTTRYEDLLSFKYTGPWPPYSFVNLRLELERTD